ncbi:porin family protein [Mesorhizobium sp. M2D.F.Ca.ET.185.01.1.1]|nr:porin family protein [Mesorhizobium sp. M2D.F.Ca.ET.140.01.1.1]TGP14569.1 porin family protein [Mesorhizobium sp. M2D.F.Ca.ET.233.01.1.1]TGP31452.1 porin family protein [Mesorhizobium sp. M2D.F.Ca.ET.232.01.1.1]TGP54425.1 porin family protein [Mesorhizobium sp. M2D.F.Ca.ET.226.01.1.1]TGP57417.1 porin family protein [bacterium M00.F.Ca.ET.230.01.1.1]TGP62708.1 porin family protein [Mesorhizobium sp. M2D.F.Ca.ET.225.01.1.1]TGP71004.1 porin family protein [Mesorhizobium sp. M2D.F.Ca.ET.224.01
MRHRLSIPSLGVALACAASAAFTGLSAARAAEAPAQAFDWSGVYVGGTIGYGWGKSHHFAQGVSSNKFTIDGALGGITVGYNYQVDRWVYGVETDLSAAGLHGEDPTGTTNWSCGAGCQTRVDWFGTLRGRLGYAIDSTFPTSPAAWPMAKRKPIRISPATAVRIRWSAGRPAPALSMRSARTGR